MDHKFSEIDHVTPLFNLFLVVHLPTHSDQSTSACNKQRCQRAYEFSKNRRPIGQGNEIFAGRGPCLSLSVCPTPNLPLQAERSQFSTTIILQSCDVQVLQHGLAPFCHFWAKKRAPCTSLPGVQNSNHFLIANSPNELF